MKKFFVLVMFFVTLFVSGCYDNAAVVKQNMTKSADNFEISRRIVMFNVIHNTPVMITEGLCSVENDQYRLSVICKIAPSKYIRNFIGKSDNIAYFIEQMEASHANPYHFRRTFKPQTFIPDIDFRGDMKALGSAFTPDTND